MVTLQTIPTLCFYTETIDIVNTKINYWRVDDDTFDTV